MRFTFGRIVILSVLLATAGTASALPSGQSPSDPYWQCVPIARMFSGIQIYGDAHTWWGQAEGRYRRGEDPKKGAVLAFIPHGNMRLGHVAAVSKIIDDRTILVTHSNWSPINGRRGQIEKNVRVIDVSDDNDWSRVRVWYAPNQELGGTAWPTHGFIYPDGKAPMSLPKSGVMTPVVVTEAGAKPKPVDTNQAVKAKDPKPTGRLAYLGKVLPKLK